MVIVYIHGAGASKDSFNYIRHHMSDYKENCFEYDIQDGFKNNLEKLSSKLYRLTDVFFVGHSMGGIYALNLANRFPKKVLGAVTLSTPYGGVEIADYVKYFFPFYQLIRDIGPNSKPIRQTEEITIKHPWTQIVTTNGTSPWIHQENDGVVTVASQKHKKGMELITLHNNHYEVVISPKVVDIIKNRVDIVKK